MAFANYSFSQAEIQDWHEMMEMRRYYSLPASLCQHTKPCATFAHSGRRGATRNTKAAGPASENPNDFFFLWARWVSNMRLPDDA